MSQVSKKINCLVLQSSPNWVLGKKMINPLNPDDVMNWVILDSSDGLLCVGHQAIPEPMLTYSQYYWPLRNKLYFVWKYHNFNGENAFENIIWKIFHFDQTVHDIHTHPPAKCW